MAEYLDVLWRPELVRKYRNYASRDLPAILDIIAGALVVDPTDVLATCRDPADDKFLAAAMTGGARFIVTEDADLLDIETHEGIGIISAEEFLRILEV